MAKQTHWWVAGGLVLAIAGCGGGGGGDDNTDPGTTPSQPNLAERIEPYDTQTKSVSADLKSQAEPSVQGLAGAPFIRKVALSAPADNLLQKTEAAAAADATRPGTPIQMAVSRDVAAAATVPLTQALLNWQPTSGGSRLAAIAFESPTAQGVRLGVRVTRLPAGATLRFYGAAGGPATEMTAAELAAQAQRIRDSGADEQTATTYWSPDFGGAQTVMEIEVPAGANVADVQVAVPRVSHFTHSAEQMEKLIEEKAGSASCNIDAMCQPDYLAQARSVARMRYTAEDGRGYYCTGTLLNDAKSSGTPYFLSANHCINTQAKAATLMTDWFYRASACNAGTVGTGVRQLTKGATLLYATVSTDTSFLRLNEAPPAGVLYAGSFYGGTVPAGSGVVGLHHPQGDLEKISFGKVNGLGVCADDSCSNVNDASGTFYEVKWSQGTTEGGSSGSAAFFGIGNQRYVMGQLYGGRASCSNPTGSDYYGRFDLSYRASIKQWLNP